ncbi:SDR family oxidoreductase [Streptomyces hygroscopicus]|uniref:SDR family oxidoreductase n=1 Tax=Streptomyces hygroscopicus TaxID=1912 RepID=UPI0036298CE1
MGCPSPRSPRGAGSAALVRCPPRSCGTRVCGRRPTAIGDPGTAIARIPPARDRSWRPWGARRRGERPPGDRADRCSLFPAEPWPTARRWAERRDTDLRSWRERDVRTTLGSRLQAAFAAARAAATRLPAGGSLTFSSGILVVRPAPGMTAPLSVAGAVETLTKALAVELAPARLRVNAIRFGRIDTPLLRSLPGLDSDDAVAAAGSTTPLGRFGTAEEAAASALFLMANNYVTGQVITVDGGETLV